MGAVFMTLYVNIIATSTRVGANANTAMDAAKAVDRISLTLREARRFEFMDNGTTGPVTYRKNATATSPSNDNYYVSSLGSTDGEKIVTGLHIVYPATRGDVTIKLPTGTLAMSGSNSMVDYKSDGGFLDVYRSDKNGVPQPATGTYLWIRGALNGVAIMTDSQAATGVDGRPLVDDIANWRGAVQFVQGAPDEVRIKIVTGKNYTTTQQATSDNRTGVVSALSAVDAKLRNYDPLAPKNTSVRGKTQYTGN